VEEGWREGQSQGVQGGAGGDVVGVVGVEEGEGFGVSEAGDAEELGGEGVGFDGGVGGIARRTGFRGGWGSEGTAVVRDLGYFDAKWFGRDEEVAVDLVA
jgi:hypothetical protein